MKVKQNTDTLRSVSAKIAETVFLSGLKIVLVIAVIFLAGVIGLAIWHSAWWLLLLIPYLPAVVIISVFVKLFRYAIRLMYPRTLNREEQKALQSYVNKLLRVSEHAKTPVFILFFRIGWDVIRKRQNGYLQEIMSDSTTLKSDYEKLRLLFE